MNLVFFYGPPASGKLTIAMELAELTGYRIFHNHLTQDLAGSINPDLGPIRYSLVEKLRLDVFEYAAKQGTDLIFTQFYTGDEDDVKFVADTIEIVRSKGGKVYIVEVTAPLEVLKERVENESRKAYGKAHDVEELEHYLATLHENSTIEHSNKIIIDSSKQAPSDSAKLIQEAFHLV